MLGKCSDFFENAELHITYVIGWGDNDDHDPLKKIVGRAKKSLS